VREAGNPGAGGYGTAADVALFYQGLLSGRATDGTQIWKPETLRMGRRGVGISSRAAGCTLG
jgi:hypothetical protein